MPDAIEQLPWVVAGGRVGEWAHCQRCGQGLTLGDGPQDANVLIGAMDGFAKSHRYCKEGQAPRVVVTIPSDWLMGRDTGISSATIYAAITGARSPYSRLDVPYDPSDFGRCYRLLKLFPDWRTQLHKTITICKRWKPFVKAWDELTALYEEELFKGDTAPKLYKRMRELVAEAESLEVGNA